MNIIKNCNNYKYNRIFLVKLIFSSYIAEQFNKDCYL